MRVAYLGPKGTYSQEAAAQHFGAGFESLFCNSLRGVVESVATGLADQAVLPIENSTNGPVNLAVDALLSPLFASQVEVCGEVQVAVRHQLYSRADNLASIRTVYSHPQVWGQVDRWLAKHLPHAQRVDCDSTAAAVALALTPPTEASPLTPPVDARDSAATAALGGPLTTEVAPLVPDCADNPANTTRFLILRRPQAGGPAVTTPRQANVVVATARDTSFAQIVALLASNNIQARFIVPRPASKDWEYVFFMELEGPGAETAASLGLRVLGWHE